MSYALMDGGRALRGLGAAVPASFSASTFLPTAQNADKLGPLFVNAMTKVMGTQDVYQNLTPPALQQALMIKTSVENVAGSSLLDIISSMSPVVINGFIGQIRQLATDISNQIFGPGTDFAWVGDEIESAIPLIGAMISIIQKGFTPAYQAAGSPCHSGDPQKRQAGCQSLYSPVIGSGPNNQIMPCDLFVSYNGDAMPDVGQALVACFEPITDCSVSNPVLCPMQQMIPPPIPKDTLDTIVALRAAIQASASPPWLQVKPTATDGGALLWPIYLDLLNYQYRSGRVNADVMNVRMNATSWWCKEMSPEASCFAWETRGYQGMLNILDGWEKTVHSPYSQYKLPPTTEQQMVAAAKKLLSKPVVKIAPNVLSSLAVKKPVVRKPINAGMLASKLALPTKPKSHPIVSAAAGATAAGLLLWFFL